MKRILAITLAAVMLLALCACSSAEQTPSTSGSAPTEASDATTPSESVPTQTTPSEPTASTPCAHAYTEAVTTEATCKTEGVKTFTCSACGDSYTEAIPTAKHDYADATCKAPQTCTVCGATKGKKAQHTFTAVCTVCGADNNDYVDITEGEWGYTDESERSYGITFYCFEPKGSSSEEEEDWETYMEVYIFYDWYLSLEAAAEEEGKSEDDLRDEYGEEFIHTFNSKEYILYGSDPDDEFTYTAYEEENDVLTIQFGIDPNNSEDGEYHILETATLKRTGFAEYTVTGGDHFPIGLKIIPV